MLVGSQSVVASASWYAECASLSPSCQFEPSLPSLTLPYPLPKPVRSQLTAVLSTAPSPSTLFSPQASRRKDPLLIWHRRARDADNSGLRTVAQGTCSVQRRVLIVHMACVALTLQGALVPFTYSLARRSLTAYIPTLPLMRKTMQTTVANTSEASCTTMHTFHTRPDRICSTSRTCLRSRRARSQHPLRNQYIYRRLMLPWVDFFSPPLSDFPHPFSSHRRRCPFCFFCILFGRPTTPSANSCRGLPRPTSMTDLRHFLRCSLLRSFVHR